MSNLGAAAGWGVVVAASLLAGALAAAVLRLPERVAAIATSFGGGILFAAIALELIPDADAGAGAALTALGLLGGTLVYVGADAWLSRDPKMDEMRRMGHAAPRGDRCRTWPCPTRRRPRTTRSPCAASRSPSASSSTACRSRSRSA
jgi:hypothetical protein